jgi:hypothetical protein
MCREGGVAGSQPMSTHVHRSQNKLWRSNSIFNLCIFLIMPAALHTFFSYISFQSCLLACQTKIILLNRPRPLAKSSTVDGCMDIFAKAFSKYFMYFVHYCFIFCPLDSVLENAGITPRPRTVYNVGICSQTL